MSNNYKNELRNANSLKEIFDITNAHFDTTAKLGTITKTVLILNIDKLISASGVKPKK